MKKILLLMMCLMLSYYGYADARRDQLVFSDPIEAQKLSSPQHGRFYVYFCSTCPSSRKRMASDVKELSELIVSTKAPLELILISDHISAKKVQQYAENVGITAAIFAEDPNNTQKISLKNIFQTWFVKGGSDQVAAGRFKPMGQIIELLRSKEFSELGVYTYSPKGIEDARVKALWWKLESKEAGALSLLKKTHKRAKVGKGTGDQIIKLFETANQALTASVENAMAQETSIAMLDSLERTIKAAKGFKQFKEAEKKLKAVKKDKGLKSEIIARKMYLAAQELSSHKKNKMRKKGASIMVAQARKYPDTLYGQRATKK